MPDFRRPHVALILRLRLLARAPIGRRRMTEAQKPCGHPNGHRQTFGENAMIIVAGLTEIISSKLAPKDRENCSQFGDDQRERGNRGA